MNMDADTIEDRLRKILDELGTLTCDAGRLMPETDLYATGLTSLASVDLMLAIEQDFGFLFPDDLLNRRTFASLGTMAAVVKRLAPAAEPVP